MRAFGEKVSDTIEVEPERLREVTGIGPGRAGRITGAWAEQKIVREIMVFLHSNGVGAARAVRIYKAYGADAVQVMSENPYRKTRRGRARGPVRQPHRAARQGDRGTQPQAGTAQYRPAHFRRPASRNAFSHSLDPATLDGIVEGVAAVFEAKFMLPWSFSEEAAGRKVYGPAPAQHVGHPSEGRGAFDYHRRW